MASRRSQLYFGRLLHYEQCTAKTRLFCSGTRKRRVMSKKERAEAVNSFVKQYMLQFPGKFPTFTLVMKEVGGSQDVLRKLLAELKMNLKICQEQKQISDFDGVHEATNSIAPKYSSTDAKLNGATLMEINSSNGNVLLNFDNMPGNDTALIQQETLSQSLKESAAQDFSDQSSLPLLLEKSCTDINDGPQESAKHEASERLSTDTISNEATDLEIDSLKPKASFSFDNISGNDVPENQNNTLSQIDNRGPTIEKSCTYVNDGSEEAAKAEALENLSRDTKSNYAANLEIESVTQTSSLSFEKLSGNDVPENQIKTLSQSIEKRETAMESISNGNNDAQEAEKSVAPENSPTDAKSNDAAVLEIDTLNKKDPSSFNSLSGNDIPQNKKSQSTRKEELISEFSSDQSMYPGFLKKIFGGNSGKVKNIEYEKKLYIHPASPKGSPGTNLLSNQEKTLLLSVDNKREGEISSEKIKNHQNNERYSSAHSKGLSFMDAGKNNLKVDKMRGGIPVVSSMHIDEVGSENSSNKEEDCSNFILKNLEQDRLGELNLVEYTNLDDRKFENANKEVNDNSVAITSNNRNLCASNTPKKVTSKKCSEVQYTQHVQGVTFSPKVDNKQKGRGSDVSENASTLGTHSNTQTELWRQTKQFGQNQSSQNFPSVDALLDHKDTDDEWEDDSDFAALDYPNSDGKVQTIIPRENNRLDVPQISEPKNLKCLLLMFLPSSATAEDLVKAFSHFGRIDLVKIIESKREENRFNYASIIFSTEEAFQKALTRKNTIVCGSELLVKEASLSNQNLCQDSTHRVAKNVTAPLAELKNSQRIIMIKDLPPFISFNHIRNALAFFGTVSRILMGPSKSTIYVEFEKDDAKERALSAHWVYINGQQIKIRRVETPRTSVVRISNLSPETSHSKILSVCNSFGCVKRLHQRAPDIADVHFHERELVKMLDILDSLNGLYINQCRWHAQSATVFSRETLHSLWSSDDGREYLHSVIQNLYKDINKNCFNKDDVRDLVEQYYGEELSDINQPLTPTSRTM